MPLTKQESPQFPVFLNQSGAVQLGFHDESGKRIVLERPLTLARYTLVIDRQGNLVSMREVKNPSTDIEEVVKIVEGLHK